LKQISDRGEGIATYNTFRRYTTIPTWFIVKLKKIVATFKLSKDGGLELFHKEDEDSLYAVCRRSAKYVDGRSYCSICQYYYPAEENKYRCPYDHIPLRISPRKKEK
jgi:hypothetical protein